MAFVIDWVVSVRLPQRALCDVQHLQSMQGSKFIQILQVPVHHHGARSSNNPSLHMKLLNSLLLMDLGPFKAL